MSQIFSKSANAWSKASIFAVLGLLASVGAAVGLIQRSDFVTAANTFKDQPVQFSHQHHVGGIGIDCRYCHTAVEVSSTAGIPPTKTCINCHSQIWSTSPYLEPVRSSFRDDKPLKWLRVHDTRYPPSEIYHFKPLDERVEVYARPFRLTRDLTLLATPEAQKQLGAMPSVTITGGLEYQACDDQICFNPARVPIAFEVTLRPLDRRPPG